jgi:hypothetical protein
VTGAGRSTPAPAPASVAKPSDAVGVRS